MLVVTLVCVQLKHVLDQRKAELTASCERLLACTHCCHEETGLYCSLRLPLQRFCPVAFRLRPFLCIFTNLEVGLQERYLPIIRGARTPSPCVPSHFNHCPQGFYPRDAMLTRVLAGTLCPSVCVCLAVTSRCSIEICGRIELVFGTQASFDLSYTVLQGTSGI